MRTDVIGVLHGKCDAGGSRRVLARARYRGSSCEPTASSLLAARPRLTLVDRVLSLIAVDAITRPEDFEHSLFVCDRCHQPVFDVAARPPRDLPRAREWRRAPRSPSDNNSLRRRRTIEAAKSMSARSPDAAVRRVGRARRCTPHGCTSSYADLVRWLVREKSRSKITPEDTASSKRQRARSSRRGASLINARRSTAWSKARGRGVVVLPTGAGKTHVAVMAIEEKKRDTLVVAPTLDLVRQWFDLLTATFGTEVGVVGGGDYSLKPLTVTTYDSAHIHMERFGAKFGIVVFDEAHHLQAKRMRSRRALVSRLTGSVSPRRPNETTDANPCSTISSGRSSTVATSSSSPGRISPNTKPNASKSISRRASVKSTNASARIISTSFVATEFA